MTEEEKQARLAEFKTTPQKVQMAALVAFVLGIVTLVRLFETMSGNQQHKISAAALHGSQFTHALVPDGLEPATARCAKIGGDPCRLSAVWTGSGIEFRTAPNHQISDVGNPGEQVSEDVDGIALIESVNEKASGAGQA